MPTSCEVRQRKKKGDCATKKINKDSYVETKKNKIYSMLRTYTRLKFQHSFSIYRELIGNEMYSVQNQLESKLLSLDGERTCESRNIFCSILQYCLVVRQNGKNLTTFLGLNIRASTEVKTTL